MNGGESKPKDRKRLARVVEEARKVRHLWPDKAIDEGFSPFPMEVWAIVRYLEKQEARKRRREERWAALTEWEKKWELERQWDEHVRECWGCVGCGGG